MSICDVRIEGRHSTSLHTQLTRIVLLASTGASRRARCGARGLLPLLLLQHSCCCCFLGFSALALCEPRAAAHFQMLNAFGIQLKCQHTRFQSLDHLLFLLYNCMKVCTMERNIIFDTVFGSGNQAYFEMLNVKTHGCFLFHTLTMQCYNRTTQHFNKLSMCTMVVCWKRGRCLRLKKQAAPMPQCAILHITFLVSQTTLLNIRTALHSMPASLPEPLYCKYVCVPSLGYLRNSISKKIQFISCLMYIMLLEGI